MAAKVHIQGAACPETSYAKIFSGCVSRLLCGRVSQGAPGRPGDAASDVRAALFDPHSDAVHAVYGGHTHFWLYRFGDHCMCRSRLSDA